MSGGSDSILTFKTIFCYNQSFQSHDRCEAKPFVADIKGTYIKKRKKKKEKEKKRKRDVSFCSYPADGYLLRSMCSSPTYT